MPAVALSPQYSPQYVRSMPDQLFPITYSTLAPQALVDRILSRYEVGKVISCVFWMRGLSDIYLVETRDNRYVLRVSHAHWRSRAEIEFELELLAFLHKNYIPVAHPLHTEDGQLAIEITAPEGKRYASLFTYANGTVPVGDLNKFQAQRLGETLARLHITAQDFQCQSARPHLTINYLLDDSLRDLSPFLTNSARLYVNEAIANIKEKICDLPKNFRFGVFAGAIRIVEMCISQKIMRLLYLILINVVMAGDLLILPNFCKSLCKQGLVLAFAKLFAWLSVHAAPRQY